MLCLALLRSTMHMEVKNKVLSAITLYGAGHRGVQEPDKKGQVLQVLKWVPIR